jgi:hypothetical protein
LFDDFANLDFVTLRCSKAGITFSQDCTQNTTDLKRVWGDIALEKALSASLSLNLEFLYQS